MEDSRLQEYRENLVSGRAFSLAEISHRSRSAYMPPITRTQWVQANRVLAHMAGTSDPLAQIASAIIGQLNLYGTRADLCAKVYESAARAVKEGYTDVIRLASPEPGRRSDAKRPYTEREIATVACYLVAATKGMTDSLPSIGWALNRICSEHRIDHPRILSV